MPKQTSYDAVVVGAGPNGLSAAIALAQVGRKVLLVEGSDTVGGGVRSEELTLPGFVHDTCSAIYPLVVGSPFLRTLPLKRHGLEWIYPPAQMAHPLDGGRAAVLHRGVARTAAGLGADATRYWHLMGPLVRFWDSIVPQFLAPLRPTLRGMPTLSLFGARAVWPAATLARTVFRDEPARALLAGCAAHSLLPLTQPFTSAFGLVLAGAGHAAGWPFPRGGAQQLANALAGYFRAIGGEIETGYTVDNIDTLPGARQVLLDVTPKQVLHMAGHHLPAAYKQSLENFRYGNGVFKLDLALDGPIPWSAPECASAATVHVGGTLDEIIESERAVADGEHPERPFVLVAQSSLFDDSRAPAGKHTVWAYCHVPNGSTADMSDRIIDQIERFAPGFRDRIIGSHAMTTHDIQAHNPNYIGGDINGGSPDALQLFARPMLRLDPYSTPAPGLFICSSSTPPGGGVHGMCGYHAAQAALRAS